MKKKPFFTFLIVLSLLCSLSCDSELEDCFKTVCTGADNTDCREEPVFDSGCFPQDNSPVTP